MFNSITKADIRAIIADELADALGESEHVDKKKLEKEIEDLKKEVEGTKQINYTIMVPHDLAIGANLPAKALSKEISEGAE